MPTSLTYIVLSTRGCSPWRPAAVMSTTSTDGDSTIAGTDDPLDFHGLSRARQTNSTSRLFQDIHPCSKSIDFRVRILLRRKDNSSQDSCQRLQVLARCRYHHSVWFRNINLIPFRGRPGQGSFNSVSLPLRIDSPMVNHCSHGTFPHFSLQSSHLNICYYHQDLH